MSILSQHIDQPDQPDHRHRCAVLDDRRIRCHDCARTILLTQPSSSTSSTSNSLIPAPGDPRCPTHHTEHAGHCRWCAAEAKADESRPAVHQPTADVAARAAEARAALPPRKPSPSAPATDPERMAQARAELANRQPIPTPEQDDPT